MFHPRPEAAQLTEERSQWELHRGGGDGDRADRHFRIASAALHHSGPRDHCNRGRHRRNGRGRRRSHCEDDRDPADGRPVQRGGRRRRGPSGGGRAAAFRRPSAHRRIIAKRLQHRDRIDLVCRQHGRLREAPGADDRDANHLPRPADRERHPGRSDPRLRHRSSYSRVDSAFLHLIDGPRVGARRRIRAADRRRGHASGHLAAERVHRPCGGSERVPAQQLRSDRRRDARRRIGQPSHQDDERRHGAVPGERAVRRLRSNTCRRRCRARERGPKREVGHRGGHRHAARLLPACDHRSGLRAGGRAGPARGARARRATREARGRGHLRHPSGRRPHARPHERASSRGERTVRAAQRDGRDKR